VLAAALLHAAWNAVVKVGLDHFSAIVLLSLAQALVCLVLLLFFPAPAVAAWPWIAASVGLHVGYKIFLTWAYSYGDLSQIYPIARGVAPMIVAVASAAMLGEPLSPVGLAAVFLVAVGVLLMSVHRGAGRAKLTPTGLGYALGTAAFTAAYTMVDGIGARLALSAHAFVFWMFVGDGLGMLVFAWLARGPAAFPALMPAWRTGLLAGIMSLGSYWIAVWAFTRAPIALVAALRETSVLFAMLMAVLLLKEPVGWSRWLAAAMITAGVVFMRL
jgi:drug/metabolite transporter (DMT)-like permease